MSTSTLIKSIELYKLFVPLQEPFIISLGPMEQVQNVVVAVHTKGGLTGWGECSPFPTINGETVDTCFLVGQYFARALKGKDAADIAGCIALMDRIIYANTSIKSAVDMALYDVAAQAAGLPLYRYLGGENSKQLQTDMTVSLNDPQKMQQDAIRFAAAGFPAIKVKLGDNKERDVQRIAAIRQGIGMHLPLRIDANQGWPTADAAIDVLQALAPFGIEHCEEPIPRWQMLDLPRVSAQSPIPIMADECLGDHHDAERLIRLKACSLFNIKLGKSGGLYKALKIATLGAQAGLKMQVGGFLESRLGMTAAAHLALANEAIVHCDLDTPLMFAADPVTGGMTYGAKGVLHVPEVPGLGAQISEAYLMQAERTVV